MKGDSISLLDHQYDTMSAYQYDTVCNRPNHQYETVFDHTGPSTYTRQNKLIKSLAKDIDFLQEMNINMSPDIKGLKELLDFLFNQTDYPAKKQNLIRKELKDRLDGYRLVHKINIKCARECIAHMRKFLKTHKVVPVDLFQHYKYHGTTSYINEGYINYLMKKIGPKSTTISYYIGIEPLTDNIMIFYSPIPLR